MIDATPGIFTRLLMLFLLAATISFAAAAQLDKSKTTKGSPIVKEDPEPWFLAGREGGCAPTSILGRKGPEYNAIQSPQQLMEKLQAAGHKAEMKEFRVGTRPAVEIKAPSAGLAVMFVKKEFCDKISSGPEKK